MSGDFYAKGTQLLHESPDFGTGAPDFLRKFCAADDDGGKAHEHANNTAEASVSLGRGSPAPQFAIFKGFVNARIMRQSIGKAQTASSMLCGSSSRSR